MCRWGGKGFTIVVGKRFFFLRLARFGDVFKWASLVVDIEEGIFGSKRVVLLLLD